MLYSCKNCGRTKHLKEGSYAEPCFGCGADDAMTARTIEVRGHTLDLRKVHDAVIDVFGTQGKFAEVVGIDQSTVSRQLRGLRKPQEWLTEAIWEHVSISKYNLTWDEDEADEAEGLSSVGLSSVDGTTPEESIVEFPKAEAKRIQQLTVAGAKGGEVNATFGMRRLKLWQRAFICFSEEGYDPHLALAAGYWCAHGYKLTDEGQDYASELFQRVFDFEATHPDSFVPNEKFEHPMEAVASILIRGGFHLYAYGETGDGKSFGMERQAVAVSPTGKIMVVSGHEAMSTEHIVASGAARGDGKGGTETFVDERAIALAARQGLPLVMDEPTVVRPGVLMVLQRLLESGVYFMPEAGIEIVAKPGFRVILTDNTRGLRDGSARYNTRHVLDEAFRDRFLFLKWGEMPEDVEDYILEEDAEAYREALAKGEFVPGERTEDSDESRKASRESEPVQAEDEEVEQFNRFLQ